MTCTAITDSISDPLIYIDGFLLYNDPPYPPLDLLCTTPTSPHYPSANNSCINHLPEAFDAPLIPSLDEQLSATPSSSRKRRAITDLAGELIHNDDGITDNLQDQPQLINGDYILQEHLPQLFMIDGDILQDPLRIDDDYAHDAEVISANYECSDLENVLDFLLMEAETASTKSVSDPHGSSFSLSELDWECGLNDSSNPHGVPSFGFHSVEVETEKGGELGASWQQKQGGETRASWQQKQGDETGASWQMKQGEIRASWQQPPSAPSSQLQIGGPLRGSMTAVWAGPTLMDIESALAMNGSPTHTNTSIAISSDSSTASSALGEVHQQEKITSFLDVKKLLFDELPMSKEELPEQDILSASWRSKLQKRSHLEPKSTVKVSSEEDAAGDGYKWRKYGQKIIKNSPFPRSYYRCSSGKCSAKKQVERCHEDTRLWLVTYEGIHLHHRPNPLRKIAMLLEQCQDEKEKSPLLMCPSSSPICGSMSSILPSNDPSPSLSCDTLLSQSFPLSPSFQSPSTSTPLNTTNLLHQQEPPMSLYMCPST